MSKAFTKEDDDGGFVAPSSSAIAIGPFRMTARGAARAGAHPDPRVREALTRADILEAVRAPERAAIGVTVHTRSARGEKSYRLVSAEERAVLGEGCSVDGPIGRALLGAVAGETREVILPAGPTELEIVSLEGED